MDYFYGFLCNSICLSLFFRSFVVLVNLEDFFFFGVWRLGLFMAVI